MDFITLLKTQPAQNEIMTGMGYLSTVMSLFRNQVMYTLLENLENRGIGFEECSKLAEEAYSKTIEQLADIQPANITKALIKFRFNGNEK